MGARIERKVRKTYSHFLPENEAVSGFLGLYSHSLKG